MFDHLRNCRNPSLGLVTKVRTFKGVGQEESPRVTFHVITSVGKCEGMNPTPQNELPLWELEFRWTPKSLESNYRGQNPLD
jgi:hypothetical protein